MKKAFSLIIAVLFFLAGSALAAPKKNISKSKASSNPALLEKGSRGPEVKKVQEKLGVNPTGYYWNATTSAVCKVQKANRLPVTGKVDEATKKYIFAKPAVKVSPVAQQVIANTAEAAKAGQKANKNLPSPAVLSLQANLIALGYSVKQTGVIDPRTLSAYKEWQNGSGWFENRGKAGVIAAPQILKIEKQAKDKAKKQQASPIAHKASEKVEDILTRFTWYNKVENTHKWVIKKVKGKKKKVLVDTDPWTKRGLTSTGAPLLKATPYRAGTAAVDPDIIPYGSKVMVPTSHGVEIYVAADTGKHVISRRAAIKSASNSAERRAIVVDCFRDSEPCKYGVIKVAPYRGSVPFIRLPKSEMLKHFNLSFAMAQFGLPEHKFGLPQHKGRLIASR